MAAGSKLIRYSIVIPVFNEEAVLPVLLHRLDLLLDRLAEPVEAIFVDDGSRDSGPIILKALAKRDPRYRYIGLSRNFGHQVAITAGMDAAQGQAIIVMDADLQDPPEVVEQLIAKWREGNDVVYARRLSRAGEGRFKLGTAHLFYRLLGKMSSVDIPADVGDFRLIDRKVLLTAVPHEHAFDRYRRALRRPYPCGGKRTTSLCSAGAAWIRSRPARVSGPDARRAQISP
jgi:polyisoprenyl-phosphate glycosyltransferase